MIKKFECGMIDFLPSSFKKYFLEHNMLEKIAALKNNLDAASLEVIDSTLKKIIHLPDSQYKDVFYYDPVELIKHFGDSRNCYDSLMTAERYAYFAEHYKFPYLAYDAEVLIYHHSLAGQSKTFKKYIKDKIFIDAGAFIGDSALVMLHYDPLKIYSFEISKKNIENYKQTMQLNNVSPEKYSIVFKGLTDYSHQQVIIDYNHEGVSEFLTSEPSSARSIIDFVSLDDFYYNHLEERERERERLAS